MRPTNLSELHFAVRELKPYFLQAGTFSIVASLLVLAAAAPVRRTKRH